MNYEQKYTLAYYSLLPNLPLDNVRHILTIFNVIHQFISPSRANEFVETVLKFNKLHLPQFSNFSSSVLKEIVNLKLIKIALDYIYLTFYRLEMTFKLGMINVFCEKYSLCLTFHCLDKSCPSILFNPENGTCITCGSNELVHAFNDIELCPICRGKIQLLTECDILNFFRIYSQNKYYTSISFRSIYDLFLNQLKYTCYSYITYKNKMIVLNKNEQKQREIEIENKLQYYLNLLKHDKMIIVHNPYISDFVHFKYHL